MARQVAGPLLTIVGETASGKSALAIELAEQFNGEIICADSRTVYKEMDIGTAKPTPEERARVPHHLLDVVTPDQSFSAAEFKERALIAISDVTARGKLPILAGGTGLYVDSILFDYQFHGPADPLERERLNALSVEELQELLQEQGIPLPENERNPRHLIRTIETGGQAAKRGPLRPNTLILGLKIDREALVDRIHKRVEVMVNEGLEEEVRRLSDKYGWSAPGLQAPAYKAFRGYIEGSLTLEQAKDLFARYDLQYAKRQRTWFKRNNSIHWTGNREEITNLVVQYTSSLNK